RTPRATTRPRVQATSRRRQIRFRHREVSVVVSILQRGDLKHLVWLPGRPALVPAQDTQKPSVGRIRAQEIVGRSLTRVCTGELQRLSVAQGTLAMRAKNCCLPREQRFVRREYPIAPGAVANSLLQLLKREAFVEGKRTAARPHKRGEVRTRPEAFPQVERERADIGSLAAIDVEHEIGRIPCDDAQRIDAYTTRLRLDRLTCAGE